MQEGKCIEVKENDREELSNSLFLSVITIVLLSDFPKIIPRRVARFLQLRVECWCRAIAQPQATSGMAWDGVFFILSIKMMHSGLVYFSYYFAQ